MEQTKAFKNILIKIQEYEGQYQMSNIHIVGSLEEKEENDGKSNVWKIFTEINCNLINYNQ